MVRDQATELRNLVQRAGRPALTGPIPTMVGVAGGKAGAGVTTAAVQLAVGLTDLGMRIALADVHLARPGVAPQCGLLERGLTKGHLSDVLFARRDIHEILVSGPGGLQILPALAPRSEAIAFPPSSAERLLNQFRTLGRHVDALFADIGSTPSDLMKTVWHACDHVLLVTTPDDQSVMDSYALVKSLGLGATATLHLLVNRAADDAECEQVYARLAQSCQRFLGLDLRPAGWLPVDATIAHGLPGALPGHRSVRMAVPETVEHLALTWQLILEKRALSASQPG